MTAPKNLRAILDNEVDRSTDTFRSRKAERTKAFWKRKFGWKLRGCVACNGSGIYDHNGSPPCGACDGSGKERYRGPKSLALDVTGL